MPEGIHETPPPTDGADNLNKTEAPNTSFLSTLHAEAKDRPTGVETESNRSSDTTDARVGNAATGWADLIQTQAEKMSPEELADPKNGMNVGLSAWSSVSKAF